MRKVIYQVWVPKQTQSIKNAPFQGIETVPGTDCFSEPQSGLFHGWGTEIHEDANSIAMYSVALVEDVTTGHVHKVDPNKMRFVQPPETRTHSKDSGARVEIVNVDQLSKATLDVLMPVLNNINKKLETL